MVLMIVRNFDFECIAIIPTKTKTPLFVDANTVLTKSIARECLQMITGRYT